MTDRQYFGLFCLVGAITLLYTIVNADTGVEFIRKLTELSGLNFFTTLLILILTVGFLFGASIVYLIHFRRSRRRQ